MTTSIPSKAPSGYLLINKDKYWSSFDVVAKLRGLTGIRKIGHAGSLDPFATGLLIVALGRLATKNIDTFQKMPKEYVATLCLGATSNTFDVGGEIVTKEDALPIEKKIIKKTLKGFLGEQEQIPPMFSAKKINGQRLYMLARKGKSVERKPALINIKKIELIDFSWPLLTIKTSCSSGTYIRVLGNDIGQALGCGAYVKELTRTKIGKLEAKNSLSLSELDENNWQDRLHEGLSI